MAGRRRWSAAAVFALRIAEAWAGDPAMAHVEHPFRHVASWLQDVDPDLREAELKSLSRAITVLSKSQKTLKSFDGVAHELGGRLAGDVSTSDIAQLTTDAALRHDQKKAQAARRLLFKLINVELALNAAEAAEAATQTDPDLSEPHFAQARLIPLPTMTKVAPSVSSDSVLSTAATGDAQNGSAAAAEEGIAGSGTADASVPAEWRTGPPVPLAVVSVFGGQVRCHVKLDPKEQRVVLAFGDSLTGSDLFKALAAPPAELRLASHGLVRETVYANAWAYRAASALLDEVGGALSDVLEANPGYSVLCAGHSFAGAVAAIASGMLEGLLNVRAPPPARRQHARQAKAATAAAGAHQSFLGNGKGGGEEGDRERTEFGAAAAAGSFSDDEAQQLAAGGGAPEAEDGETASAAAAAGAPTNLGWRRCIGAAKGRISCVALGCPPCLSRNIALPFVTSFILGDDLVPRLSERSLAHLRARLAQVLPRGRGLLSQGLAAGTSFFSDAAGLAMQGVRQFSTAGEDDTALSLPGRVWFVKPRRLHGGATMTRVMRGNLREDVMWQVHDVLLTKSMLSHHRLSYYISALDRV